MNIKTYQYTDETLTETVNWVKECTLETLGMKDRAGEFAFIVRQPNILGKVWHKLNGSEEEGRITLSVVWANKPKKATETHGTVPGEDTLS
jgi:hypothetical protein